MLEFDVSACSVVGNCLLLQEEILLWKLLHLMHSVSKLCQMMALGNFSGDVHTVAEFEPNGDTTSIFPLFYPA